MADQKNTPQQRGNKKKSDKKSADGGAKTGRSSKRRVMNYWSRGHKSKNKERNFERQVKQSLHANQPTRTPAGTARALRRASVNLATGATSNLAATERQMRDVPLSPEERREDALEKLFRATFGASPEQAG